MSMKERNELQIETAEYLAAKLGISPLEAVMLIRRTLCKDVPPRADRSLKSAT